MRILKFIAFIAAIVIGVYMLCGITGIFKIYYMPTSSMEPAIKTGGFAIVSNIANPKKQDLIVYKKNNFNYTHRLAATAGDTLEIINGKVWVNSNDFDKNLLLKHTYKLMQNDIQKIISVDNNAFIVPAEEGYFYVQAEDNKVKSIQIKASKIVESKNKPNYIMSEIWSKDYNKDFFGPVVIPENKIFVLGDNRDNSEDSRYHGFIDTRDIVGVVVR